MLMRSLRILHTLNPEFCSARLWNFSVGAKVGPSDGGRL